MTTTPAEAWAELLAGNERFVRGEMEHPSQDVDHRASLSAAQSPFAVVFGCSDSRVAAEIIFDRGLGDLFVVRTAGHVIDTTVLGSVEYGVQVLGTPLVLVLGHDSCGAVAAAADALTTGTMPQGFVRAVVDRVIPSIVALPDSGRESTLSETAGSERTGAAADGSLAGLSFPVEPAVLGREHVRHTVRMLLSYSAAIREGVAAGRCAVVGATYALAEGQVRVVEAAGLE